MQGRLYNAARAAEIPLTGTGELMPDTRVARRHR